MKIHMAVEIFIFALWAVSFNLLFGHGGMLAFGFGAPFGVGAYCAALFFNHLPEVPLILTVSVVALIGFIAGILLGSLSVRLKGAYFSLITFAFQMFLYTIALKWRSVTGGDDGIGINRPDLYLPLLGKFSLMNVYNLYYFILVVVSLGIITCYLFQKTPLGNSIACVKENDVRASFLGYNIYFVRLAAFSISSSLAALSGSLFVLFNGIVATNCIDMNISLTVLLMAVIGGTSHFLGPVLGAAFYIVFQDWLSSLTQRWWLFLGILYVVIILYIPEGLISLFKPGTIRTQWSRLKDS